MSRCDPIPQEDNLIRRCACALCLKWLEIFTMTDDVGGAEVRISLDGYLLWHFLRKSTPRDIGGFA
jgi:hypothetical protein